MYAAIFGSMMIEITAVYVHVRVHIDQAIYITCTHNKHIIHIAAIITHDRSMLGIDILLYVCYDIDTIRYDSRSACICCTIHVRRYIT